MQTTEEAALLRRIRQDPQEGVAQLLSCYGGMLQALVRRILPDDRDAEECLADVLVQCWRQAEGLLAGQYRLKAWLIVTARNKAIDRYRQLRRAAADPLPEDFELLAQQCDSATASEAEELIAELVEQMEAPDRDIFIRRYYGLQSSKEIGLALGMEEHTVNVRLSRGRARLKQQFLQAFGKEPGYGKAL